MSAETPAFVQAFINDLASQGVEAHLQGPAVIYSIPAVSGGLVNQKVPTGVSVNELTGWPAVPPHWVHFPTTIIFEQANTDTADCLDGWQRHSRDIGTWSTNRPPILNWLAHVRGIVAGAQS
ncbi:hypothetical protein [Herbiconiux ginsengi]|uniref:Uncharacterized protein n=1 Tax=Herbiconiux ginsengi TaxID=381665 RepID=A0A1H3RMS3_9MICO|nr:hypothetical protein [Herbiconiux ginsengi]SDZ26665.1 hypothetical protein SAMN05216554_2912 [Herbiconiux ginsengi]